MRPRYWVFPVALGMLGGFGSAEGAGVLPGEIAEKVHSHHISQPPIQVIPTATLEELKAYLGTLDSHSTYLTAAEYRLVKTHTKDGYRGIGVEVFTEQGRVILVPFKGGAAFKAGLSQPSFLVNVDDQAVQGMKLDEIGELLTGPEGSTVSIEVSTSSKGRTRRLQLRREQFLPGSVELVMESEVPYVRIRQFVARETATALRGALKRVEDRGNAVVLDLRYARGGDLYEALDAVSLFLPGGKIIAKTRRVGGEEQSFRSLPDRQVVSGPVLLLVGPHTASAGEVFAVALRYHTQALLIGQQTYGKCTSQTYVELSDGSALKLTNLEIFLPSGERCNGIGLKPDISVGGEVLHSTADLIDRGMRRLVPNEKVPNEKMGG